MNKPSKDITTNDNDSTFQDPASAGREIKRLEAEKARLAAALDAAKQWIDATVENCSVFCDPPNIDPDSTALRDLLAPTVKLEARASKLLQTEYHPEGCICAFCACKKDLKSNAARLQAVMERKA